MGSACSKSDDNIITKEELLKNDPNSVPYSSRWDLDLRPIEERINILKTFPFLEYSYLLMNHKTGYSNSTNKLMSEEISQISFKNFIDNKIKNHYLLENEIDDNDFHIFSNYIQKFYKYLLEFLRFVSNDEEINNIRKIDLIPLGLLYSLCHSSIKIDFLFALFSNEEGYIENSREFKIFIYLTLAVPGAILYYSVSDIVDLYINSVKLCDVSLIDASEKGDIRELMKKVVKQIFGSEMKLNKEQFCSKLLEINWILSPKGIRMKLDENNIEREKRKAQNNGKTQ